MKELSFTVVAVCKKVIVDGTLLKIKRSRETLAVSIRTVNLSEEEYGP
ncbi:MAG: hypothetical protein GY906_18255 [bacterium]|nr:hypothetical protein [bacterium]